MPAEIEFTVRLTVMSAKGFRSASRRMGGMQRGVIKLQWLRGVRRHAVAVAVREAEAEAACPDFCDLHRYVFASLCGTLSGC